MGGGALLSHHRRDPDHAGCGIDDHDGARPVHRARLQHHLHCVRGTLCRYRRRFRNPVLRALSRRAACQGRPEARSDPRRSRRRDTAGARCGGDGRGVFLVPADELCRGRRARAGCRYRNGRRLRALHHAASGLTHAVQALRRTGRDRLCLLRDDRPHHDLAPGAGSHRRGRDRARRARARELRQVRFQSARPAQRQDRIRFDHSRPDAGSPDLAQYHRRAGAEPERGTLAVPEVVEHSPSRTSDHARRFRTVRSGKKVGPYHGCQRSARCHHQSVRRSRRQTTRNWSQVLAQHRPHSATWRPRAMDVLRTTRDASPIRWRNWRRGPRLCAHAQLRPWYRASKPCWRR